MIKTILSSLLLVISLVSCNSSPSVEGFWIDSYYQSLDPTNDTIHKHSDVRHLIQIKDNRVRVKVFENKELSIPATDKTFSFTLSNNKMIIEDESTTVWDVLVFKDSMVVTSENVKCTYIKLPISPKKVDWNPKGKFYKSKTDEQTMYQDYTDKYSVYVFFINDIAISKYDWQLQHINNYSFLLYKSRGENTPLLIDSIVKNKVYITNYTFEKKSLILEEQQYVSKKTSRLFGEWKLVSKKEINETDYKQLSMPLSMNNLRKFRIEEDSITIFNDPFKHRSSWKYYDDEKIISLEEYKQKLIKVLQLTKDELVVEMNLGSNMGRKKRFTFKRE